MKPIHKHDCQECVLLGRLEKKQEIHPDFASEEKDWPTVFAANTSTEIDLYFCKKGRPTVIARYSDEPSDYASGLHSALAIPELGFARDLAKVRGLLGS